MNVWKRRWQQRNSSVDYQIRFNCDGAYFTSTGKIKFERNPYRAFEVTTRSKPFYDWIDKTFTGSAPKDFIHDIALMTSEEFEYHSSQGSSFLPYAYLDAVSVQRVELVFPETVIVKFDYKFGVNVPPQFV